MPKGRHGGALLLTVFRLFLLHQTDISLKVNGTPNQIKLEFLVTGMQPV
jgi:hypothetical protein